MGGTYQQWLRYQEKQERLARRLEQQEQAQRTARNRASSQSRNNPPQTAERPAGFSALHGVLVAGPAAVLLVAGTVVKQVWRQGYEQDAAPLPQYPATPHRSLEARIQ
jgi:hypothetical protein